MAVQIHDLTRRFGSKLALDHLSLDVPAGTVLGLVGENGAGKTTLIRHVLGLLKAESGSVSVFGMFLFMQAMKAVPDELLQAGRVDGCSELRLWWEIALPIVRPMIGAYTLLSFLGAWNSYLWPNTVLQDEAKYTLPIGLAGMLGLPEFESHYGVLMVSESAADVLALKVASPW